MIRAPMNKTFFVSGFLLTLVGTTHANPKPPAPGSIESDIAAVRQVKTWPVRQTFLGWTAANKPVYRSLVCVSPEDEGGGRGAYCEIVLCKAKHIPVTELEQGGECEPLLVHNFEERGIDRTVFKDAEVKADEKEGLVKLGALSPGKAFDVAKVRASIVKNTVNVSWPASYGDASANVYSYSEYDNDDRRQGASLVKVASASASPDGRCVVVIGHYLWQSHYESVTTYRPIPFAKLSCR